MICWKPVFNNPFDKLKIWHKKDHICNYSNLYDIKFKYNLKNQILGYSFRQYCCS